MSQMNLYTMFDRVAEEYGPTFEAKNDSAARRSMQVYFMKQDPQSFRPDDFRLYRVASIRRMDAMFELTREGALIEVSLAYAEQEI